MEEGHKGRWKRDGREREKGWEAEGKGMGGREKKEEDMEKWKKTSYI